MEALRTYIKDKIGFVLFFNGMVIFLGIFFAFSISDILSDFSSGSINDNTGDGSLCWQK